MEITTTNSGTGSMATVDYCATVGPNTPLPVRSLFEVEVDGLLGFSLIPKNQLAKDLAGAWLGGAMKATLEGFTPRRPAIPLDSNIRRGAMDVTALRIRVEPGVLLTKGGDPFFTGQTISDEEQAVALAAIEAHRESRRPKKRSRRR